MENVKYKTSKIVRAKEVGLLLYIANILIALKFTGINYIHDLVERETAIQQLLKELVRALERGFDPFFTEMESNFVKEIGKKSEDIEENEPQWDYYDWNCPLSSLLQKENFI